LLSGCAALDEMLMPEAFDDPYYVAPAPYRSAPPGQPLPFAPAGQSAGTTREPELLSPRN
jgi:hypothetical protein